MVQTRIPCLGHRFLLSPSNPCVYAFLGNCNRNLNIVFVNQQSNLKEIYKYVIIFTNSITITYVKK